MSPFALTKRLLERSRTVA